MIMEDYELVKEKLQFIRIEFEQNFAYLKHMEEVRLKHTTIYLTMIGALAAFVSSEPKGATGSPRAYTPSILAWVFLGLSLYGLFFACFLVYQKNGYESYRKQNLRIREWFHEGLSASLHLETRQSDRWRSAFWYWYLLVVTISSLSFGLFLHFLPLVSASSRGCYLVAFVLWVALFRLIEGRAYLDCTRSVGDTPTSRRTSSSATLPVS
jgi:hypothetical protein